MGNRPPDLRTSGASDLASHGEPTSDLRTLRHTRRPKGNLRPPPVREGALRPPCTPAHSKAGGHPPANLRPPPDLW